MNRHQLRARLRRACAAVGGQAAFARQAGCNRAYINAVLHERRPPSARILAALGVMRVYAVKAPA
jgi:hypothetical protein